MCLVQKKAREKALNDWKNKNVYLLVNGRINLDLPAFSKNHGFYIMYFCTPTLEDALFVETYNSTIIELIKKEGIPDWSPVNLIPSKETLITKLNDCGKDISCIKENYFYIKEKRLIKYVLRKWRSGKPIVWTELEETNVLIIGGLVSIETARVDILDLNEMRWLERLEFSTKNYPKIKWGI